MHRNKTAKLTKQGHRVPMAQCHPKIRQISRSIYTVAVHAYHCSSPTILTHTLHDLHSSPSLQMHNFPFCQFSSLLINNGVCNALQVIFMQCVSEIMHALYVRECVLLLYIFVPRLFTNTRKFIPLTKQRQYKKEIRNIWYAVCVSKNHIYRQTPCKLNLLVWQKMLN